jgi:AP endonuclease-2
MLTVMQGSDHCPVFGVIKQTVEVDGKSKHILDLVNPTGTFRHGVLQKTIPYPPKPRLCMKRFSEFQNRQSIKDMFRKAPQKPPNPPLDNQSKSLQSNWSAPSSESPVKKLKISSTAQKPRSQPSNQKNLRAFFKCASDTVSCSKVDDSQLSASLIHQTGEISATSVAASQPAEAGEDDFVDPIESKEKWTQLFSKRPVPQCDGHGEDAIQRITKKPGPNCGRAFWMCQRYVLFFPTPFVAVILG